MTDKNNINKKQDNNDRNSYVGFGVVFGLLGGSVLSTIVGIFFEFPLLWAFGPGLGVVIGSIFDLYKSNE